MLKKLLKYDLKAIFKFWWIAAASTILLSLFSGGFLAPLENGVELPMVASMLGSFVLLLLMASFSGFIILSEVLIFIRFYKNFFSDEGYLTFTLPVKRTTLINSKLISGVLTMVATGIVYIIDIVIIVMVINIGDNIDSLKTLFFSIIESIKDLGIYFFIYFIEIIIIMLLIAVFSTLFIYACITIGSVIAKRAKVIVAIGIYYGASSTMGFLVFMFLISLSGIDGWFNKLSTDMEMLVMALILLLVIAFISLVCVAVYAWQYYLIDRKLNLS